MDKKIKMKFFLAEVDNRKLIENFEKEHQVTFPGFYKEIVSWHDFITPEKNIFFYGSKSNEYDSFSFSPWQEEFGYERVSNIFKDPPEFFPKEIVIFASNGGGDYLCFDYRNCRENPPIVLWLHEEEENEGIVFLSSS
ncbi:MAG: SMI1/KNR4 family protein, partial [Chlamydiae bacterium]|nr:SMI1/KNR4 family protein [Chlamydiota bacterium]